MLVIFFFSSLFWFGSLSYLSSSWEGNIEQINFLAASLSQLG
uniref:Uncharacterized protein n=1 Tax=Arundo donax TaxID=35708 RepID=A0A0A9GWM7_ARUDO